MAPTEGGGQDSLFGMFLPMAMIFGIFYFLLIRPARKKQNEHQEMLRQLKNGDRVVTTGGMFGTVVGITDEIVQLRVADQVKIEFARSAIAGMQGAVEEK
ncbi:hypothetical protein ABI59_01265 [Acidobacteria bacterium Mor1]|nr:hypothetical protein ABI59_01265 [Acidobacteria bacterium Mor1]